MNGNWMIHELWDADEVMGLPGGLTLSVVNESGLTSGTPTKVGT